MQARGWIEIRGLIWEAKTSINDVKFRHFCHKEFEMAITILGISAFYHDSAACIVQDGKIVAAAQEERFTRKKHDFDFPRHAAEYCLNAANVSIDRLIS